MQGTQPRAPRMKVSTTRARPRAANTPAHARSPRDSQLPLGHCAGHLQNYSRTTKIDTMRYQYFRDNPSLYMYPVCTSIYQSIPVYTSLTGSTSRRAPNLCFHTHKTSTRRCEHAAPQNNGTPGRATEGTCSYMRQPPPRGRRRPSTAAQAAGGPSLTALPGQRLYLRGKNPTVPPHSDQ